MYTRVCLNSVFHNQLLSGTWQATILLPRQWPTLPVPALSPLPGPVLSSPVALTCLAATQLSSALKCVSALRTRPKRLLVLLDTCCPHPFMPPLWHASNFCSLFKKSRILSREVLCKYPSLREAVGKHTSASRWKYIMEFGVRSVGKTTLPSWYLSFPGKRTLRKKKEEETMLKKKRRRGKYVALHRFHIECLDM